MTFGEKLYKMRKSRGMSQNTLAAKLNLTRQAISKWEQDSILPSGENVVKIAQLFNVSTDYLLNEEAEKKLEKTVLLADSYDNINFFGALASTAASVCAVVYYLIRLVRDYCHNITLPARDLNMFVYGDRVIYETVDEIVILIFLVGVTAVSALAVKRIYRKYNLADACNFLKYRKNLNKNIK